MMLKPGLEQPTERIAALPVHNGYPVPWFVDWIDGVPEFRAMNPKKRVMAVQMHLCWVCGGKLGRHKTFVVGPMCGINRVSAEPPSHVDCAHWSARNCPFLSNPNMVRNEKGMEGGVNPAGIMIKRNPGVTLLWKTASYETFRTPDGGWLIQMGEPTEINWYARGRQATLEEVLAAVDSGLPNLMKAAEEGGPDDVKALLAARVRFLPLLPKS